jgi:hypothetical protein
VPPQGIFASTFDVTGTRLITCEADKSIKMWKEDTSAVSPAPRRTDFVLWRTCLTDTRWLAQTPETHPVDYKPSKRKERY